VEDIEESQLALPDEAFTSIEEIRSSLVDIRKSEIFRKLQLYYSRRSVFDIVGVSRKEDTHSRLLGWLLNPDESHNLGAQPLRRLLEAVVVVASRSNQRIAERIVPTKVFNWVIAGSYRLSETSVTIEKPIRAHRDGRIDALIEGTMAGNKMSEKDGPNGGAEEAYPFRILIENKVESAEHNQQTKNYEKWLTQTRDDRTVDVPLFLTPLPTLELDELEEPQCASGSFIQINYQYLVDYVITPSLQGDIGPQVRWILEEYARTLSYPASTKIDDATVMALGNKERELLSDFWNEHSVLLRTMMSAISQDPDQEEEVREAARKFANVSSKDHSDVQIVVDGEPVRTFPYKTDVGHEVVRVLLDRDLLTDEMFHKLRIDTTTGRPLLKQKNEMDGDEAERRYRTKKDQMIEYNGERYYASSQWSADKIGPMNQVVSEVVANDGPSVRIELI